MRITRQKNNWEMKKLKRDQYRYFLEQNKKNTLISETLCSIQSNISEMRVLLEKSINGVDNNLSYKIEMTNNETVGAIKSLHEDLNHVQELIRIIVANQLIDQI